MDLIYIVPARGGSKRLARKNIRPLAGKSLLEHTAQAVAQTGLSGTVLLTTDDAEMAAEGKRLGWQVPFLRPSALATDTASTMDVVLHALDWVKAENGGDDPTITVLLQPTSPLRGADCIRDAVELLKARQDCDSVVGMAASHLPQQHFYTMDEDGTATPIAARGATPVYYPNGAIYAMRTEKLRHCRTFFTDRTVILPMPPAQSVDIDTIDDWDLAEAILEHQARKRDA
jgi:CMP-N,N'-diacetyllegionaminic acid synthase